MLAVAAVLLLRDYHVGPSGDDANPGTAERPWRTLTRVNAVDLEPGDRVLLEGGAVFRGGLVLEAEDAGTRERPVVVGSTGRGRAVLEAPGTAILVRDAGGMIVRDLVLRGSRKGDGLCVVNELPGAAKLDFVRIENVEASGFLRRGIGIDGAAKDGSKSGFRDVRIAGCTVRDNVYYGIQVAGPHDPKSDAYAHADVAVVGCRAHDNPGDPEYRENHSGNGIQLGEVDGGLIEGCVAWNNGALCNSPAGGPVGIWAWSSRRVTIRFCESYGNRTGAASVDGGGFDFDGGVSDSVLEFNYSHGNDGAGLMVYSFKDAPHRCENNVVRFNVSEDDGRHKGYAGIYVGQHGDRVKGVEVSHNTVFVRPSPRGTPRAVWVHDAEDVRFRNNALVTEGGAALLHAEGALKDVVFQGNAWWSSGGPVVLRWGERVHATLEAWREASGQERRDGRATGLFADPRFEAPGKGGTVGDPAKLPTLAAYRLRPGSPLIDAGLPLEGALRDFAGVAIPRGRAADVGAFEFVPEGR
jgi:hypothetical protein